MRRLLVGLSLFLPVIASAEFFRLDKVPAQIKPASFDHVRPAALQIVSKGEEFGCSATIISKQGHVLTGLHCIPQCVSMRGNSAIKSFQYVSPDMNQIRNGKANCSIPFAQEGRGLGSMSAQVVAAGVGYVLAAKPKELAKELDKHVERRAVFSQIIDAGIGIPGDFAILYVPKLAGRACAKTLGRAPVVSERIWNIGYPGSRDGAAAFSHGSVTSAVVGKPSYEITSGEQGWPLILRRHGMFVGTIEANQGSSGSGAFSYNGDLVGVLNAAQLGGKSFASSIKNVIDYTTANYGATITAQSFNCQ